MKNLISAISSDIYQKIETPIVLEDKEATSTNVKSQISQLARKVNQGDVIFLFFSGHGAVENDETYFLTTDTKAEDLFSSALDFDNLRKIMRTMVSKQCKVLVFMDACHAGALFKTKAITESLQFAEPGVIGFYSSTASQRSNEADIWKNGIFTKALIEGIKGKAKNNEGKITIFKLQEFVQNMVKEQTKGMQTPIVENKQGDFVLF